MDRRIDLAVALAVVAFGAFVLIVAQSIRPFGPVADPLGPAAFPRILGTALLIGGVTIVAVRLRSWRTPDGRNIVPGDGEPDEPGIPASARRAFGLMALTFVYAVTLPILGYLIGTVLYVPIALWVMNVRSPWVVVVGVLYALATYFLFAQLANARLPPGPLLDVLRALGLER